jgi:hypothetical protein
MCLQIFQRKRGLRNPAKIGDARSFCRRGCSVGHYYDLEDAQQLDYIAYTGRHPFTTDAYQLGFLPGFCEDGGYQDTTYSNVDVPIGFLDNDFSNPDLDRYLTRFERFDPSVAMLGDAYSEAEADLYNEVVAELRREHPYKRFVVVPKCREAFDRFADDMVLGYPNGYSDPQADELGLGVRR